MILDKCLSGTRLKNRSLVKECSVVGWTKALTSFRTLLPLAESDRQAQLAENNLALLMKLPTARHAHVAPLCCVSERTTGLSHAHHLHRCSGAHMALSRTASARLNRGSNPQRGARRTSSRNLAPLSPAQNQSGRLASTVPPTSLSIVFHIHTIIRINLVPAGTSDNYICEARSCPAIELHFWLTSLGRFSLDQSTKMVCTGCNNALRDGTGRLLLSFNPLLSEILRCIGEPDEQPSAQTQKRSETETETCGCVHAQMTGQRNASHVFNVSVVPWFCLQAHTRPIRCTAAQVTQG